MKCSRRTVVVFLVFLLALPSFVVAQSSDLCSRQIGGLAGLPTLDGQVVGDVGWARAVEYNFDKGQGVPFSGKVLVGHTSNHVYVGIYSEISPGQEKIALVGFGPPSGPAGVAHIYLPPNPSQVLYTGAPQSIGNGWANSTDLMNNQDWNVQTHSSGQNDPWSVEIRIPRLSSGGVQSNGVAFPSGSSATFKMYINVLNTVFVSGGGGNGVVQAAWPETAEINSGLIDNNVPLPADWGTASLGSRSACSGVKLDMFDVGTQTAGVAEDEIKLGNVNTLNCSNPGSSSVPNADNTFFAEPENTGSGQANSVSVGFRLADWGVSAQQFNQIPVASNPTAPKNIQGNQTENYQMNWQLTEQQACQYRNRRHQCILVQMSSNATGTRFLNKGVTRNMDFVSASTFTREATVNLRGLRPPSGQSAHTVLLDVQSQIQRFRKEGEQYRAVLTDREEGIREEFQGEIEIPVTSSLLGIDTIERRHYENGLAEAMTWVARSFAVRSDRIRIQGTDYRKVQYLGGFGVVAGHPTENVTAWSHDLAGPGLNPLEEGGKDYYQLRVSEEEPVPLDVEVEAQEEGEEEDTGGGISCSQNQGNGSSPGIILFVGLAIVGRVAYRRFQSSDNDDENPSS